MPSVGFLIFWVPVAFVFLAAASFVGTMLALQVYYGDRTLAFSEFTKRFYNDRGQSR